MLIEMTVARRLALGFSVPLILTLLSVVSASSALKQSDAAMRTIYEDRAVPLDLLSDIRYLAARDRLILLDAAYGQDPAKTRKRIAEFEKNRTQARGKWDRYMATYLTTEEAALVDRQVLDMSRFVEKGLLPAADALRREDYLAAREFLAGPASTYSPPAQSSLQDLLELQVRMAKTSYELATAENHRQLVVMLLIGGATGVFTVLTTLLISRRIVGQLGAEPHELAAVASRVASGNLTQEPTTRAAPLGSVMTAMQSMRQTLQGIVLSVRCGVDSVATASGQLAQGNRALSARSEEQSSSLQQTAAAIEQLNNTIKSTADNAQSALLLVQTSVEAARRAEDQMASVVTTFDDIQGAARRMTEIIGVIDVIAFQTNILALNAAVEASRAADLGRGFAVVAGEVRALAQRSAEAAKHIKQLIAESAQRIEDGSAVIAGMGKGMRDMVKQVDIVGSRVAQIATESSEQSAGVSQIGRAMHQLETVAQQNAVMVEQVAAAASTLLQQAGLLSASVSAFRAEPATV